MATARQKAASRANLVKARAAKKRKGVGIEQHLAKRAIDRMQPGIKRSVAASKYRKTYGIPKVKPIHPVTGTTAIRGGA
jgi:hypothetical protein